MLHFFGRRMTPISATLSKVPQNQDQIGDPAEDRLGCPYNAGDQLTTGIAGLVYSSGCSQGVSLVWGRVL